MTGKGGRKRDREGRERGGGNEDRREGERKREMRREGGYCRMDRGEKERRRGKDRGRERRKLI